MSEPVPLRPPEKWTHLRWHWLVPHNDYDKEQSREEPEICEWIPFQNREHYNLDFWKTSTGSIRPEGASYLGWRYHGSCDPAAITPDPGDEAQRSVVLETLDREYAACAGKLMPHKTLVYLTNRVLTALAPLGRGK